MENSYFENERNLQPNEDELLKRIKECELVVEKLSSDVIWEIVIKDAKVWMEHLDSMWQDVFEEDKLKQMRVLKLAYKHVADLPKKYKETLASLQANLESSIEREE